MMKSIPIEGCEHYEISEDGVVINTKTGKVLRPDLSSGGYHRICLHSNGRIRKSVHRLVAMTFIDNPEGYPVVNHKDGNKLNNHYLNLEWCSVSHNTRHAFKEGLRNLDFQYKGPAHNRSLTDKQVVLIRRLKGEGWKRKDIVELVGCSVSAYKRINKYYKHVK